MKVVMLLLVLMMVISAASAQGIYKWVDEQGQVHFGERPPEDAQASEVTVKPPPPSAPVVQQDRKENTQRLLRAFEEERMDKEEKAAKEAQESAQRKRACTVARDRLRRYQEARGFYNLDANGERRILNDAEHAATISRAEEAVKQYCK